jgi:hypothetical protein
MTVRRIDHGVLDATLICRLPMTEPLLDAMMFKLIREHCRMQVISVGATRVSICTHASVLVTRCTLDHSHNACLRGKVVLEAIVD